MIKKGAISRRLYEHLAERGKRLHIEEARIGLGYAGVMLESKSMGLAAILRSELQEGCSVLSEAGSLAGISVAVLLKHLVDGKNPLERALGLASANAIISPEEPEVERDTIALMNLTSADRVAMVGYFGPLLKQIQKRGAALSIIERNAERAEVLDRKTRERILKECTVAIITATAILNNTIEDVLNSLGEPRHVTILGPSTPLCREIFEGTPVTHLGGSAVVDRKKIFQIISEAGGTPAMRPYLRFVNILL